MSTEPFRKVCNCLVANAEIDPRVAATLGAGPVMPVLERFKDHYGGLWVGGTLFVDASAIHFRPNWLNRLVHKGDYSLSVPLSSVADVSVEHGFVTNIVVVTTADGQVKFRCYGAKAVVQRIVERLPSRAEPAT